MAAEWLAATSTGVDVAGLGYGMYQGQRSYTAAKHNLEWQQKVQRTEWARQDNAVQRRARDLQAAGMSKTLAAGNAAQSGAVVKTDAPQYNPGFIPKNLGRDFADITQTLAQAALTREQAEWQKMQNEGRLPGKPGEKLQAEIEALRAAAAEHYAGVKVKLTQQETADYELFMKRLGGFTSQAGWIAGTAGSIIAYTKANMDQLTNDVKMGRVSYRDALKRLDSLEREAAELESKQGKVIPESKWPRRR